jgi:hypothetical protein
MRGKEMCQYGLESLFAGYDFVCQYDLNSLRRGLTNQGDSFVNTHQSEVCI